MNNDAYKKQQQNLRKLLLLCLVLPTLLLYGCGGGGGGGGGGETPVAATLDSIALLSDESIVAKGRSTQLTATGTYSDASIQDLTSTVSWSVGDNAVLSVDSSGLLTALTAGTTTVTATSGTVQNSIDITVSAAELDAIALSSDEIVVIKGASTQLSATGTYSDASIQDLTSTVSWSVGDNAVLSVDNSGLLTALTAGTTTVTATSGAVQGSIDITASPATLDTIELRSEESVVAKGTSTQLSATGLYSDASTQDLTAIVSWSVGNNALLSVDSAGLLTSLETGSTTVTATSGIVQGSIDITVSPATLTSLTLSPQNQTVASGTSLSLTVSGLFSDGSTQDLTSQSTWVSSALAVATIDTPGLLTTLSPGSTTITVTNGDRSDTTSVTVSPATLDQIELNLIESEIALGTGIQAEAIGLFSDNTTQNLTSLVTWSSSDDTVATIVSLSDNAGWVESVSTGTTQLSANYSGITTQATFEVTAALLTAIDLIPTELSMAAGLMESYTATGRYSDGTVQDLTELVVWQSSAQAVATVDNSSEHHGEVQSLTVGLSTISATFGGITSNSSLTITSALLESISLTVDAISVAAGSKIEFLATGHYSDGSTADLTQQANWLSTNESVVSSDQTIAGLFTSQAAGSAIISAGVDAIFGFQFLTVTAATLTSITIDQATPTIALGTQFNFTATGHYSDASTQDISSSVTWQSDNESVATISNSELSQGEANGVTAGSASISAHLDLINGATILTISPATLSSITLSGSSDQLVDGTTMALVATAHFSDSSTQDFTQFVTWSSSAEGVASISNKEGERGLVTAITAGSADFSAQLDALSADSPYSLTIVSDPNAPVSLALSVAPNVILNNGSDNSTLSVTLQPAETGGTIADNTVIEFEITEGETVTPLTANTLNGSASIQFNSSYSGMISITATVQGSTVDSSASLFSTSTFANVLSRTADMLPIYDNNTYRIGSWFGLYLQNYSNRDFDTVSYQITNGGVIFDQTFDSVFLSDGSLIGGEATAVIYILDNDEADSGISATYQLEDPATSSSFGFTANYSIN